MSVTKNPRVGRRQSAFHRHRKKTLFAIAVGGWVLLALGFEAYFALTSARPASGHTSFRFIPLAERRPGLVTRVTADFESESMGRREYRLEVDDDGFIAPSKVHDDPDVVIAFLGGSTTECMLVDEDKRFPHLVGRLLEPELGKVNSYNCAKAGAHSLHSLLVLMVKVLPLQPDAVVMMHAGNDLIILMYEGTYWSENRDKRMVAEYRAPRETPTVLVKKLAQSLFPHLYARLVSPPRELAESVDPFAHLRGTKLELDEDFLQSEFRRNLRMFIGICRARDIAPVLMTQANRLTDEPDEVVRQHLRKIEKGFGIGYADYRRLWDMYNDAIRDVGREEDVLVVDLEREVPKDERYMYDLCHYHTTGSEYAAAIIADRLRELRLR